MTVYIHHTFLADLRDSGDAGFAQRVLRKVIESNGAFRIDKDDHRYQGIDDAWIRYVSTGKSAYRAIYLRKGEDVHLYRAGPHAIEDNLSAPKAHASVVELFIQEDVPVTAEAPEVADGFLQNGRKRLLRTFLLGRRLIPHEEVMLVSPYLSMGLLQRSSRFGTTIDNLIEDGTKVSLITRWPTLPELDDYRALEERGIELLFHRSVHAKLYLFTVRASEIKYGQGFTDAALIGSANLTDKGFGFDERDFNEELCFELPLAAHEGAVEFVYHLAGQSIDLKRVRHELTRR